MSPHLLNPEELDAWIVDQLVIHSSRDDIILEVCNRTGMDWNHAEARVQAVELYRAEQIRRRRSPLWILLGVAIMIGGIVLIGISVWSVIEVARGLQASGVDALTAVVESIFLNAQIILIFLLGVGMLVGGGYGLGEALSG